MPETNLMTFLHIAAVEPIELEQVLLSHFNRGSGSAAAYRYGREDGENALTLAYGKRGEIISATPGPDLRADDLELIRARIEGDLLEPGPRMVIEKVLFATRRTIGSYRYEDEFQLVPVPSAAPQPQFTFGDFPLLLEVAFEGSSNRSVAGTRGAIKCREIELALATLINHRLHSGETGGYAHWVLDSDGKSTRCIYRQAGYDFEGRQFLKDMFSDTAETPALSLVDHQSHYAAAAIDGISVFDLPATFPESIRHFLTLDDASKRKFLRASYWLQHSERVWSLSKSASYVALVSAIEALIAKSTKGDRCKECGALQGAGPTDRFINFLEGIFPGVLPKDARRDFYRVRSNLAHGESLLYQDQGNWGIGLHGMNDWHRVYSLGQIVRAALMNWLHRARPAPT